MKMKPKIELIDRRAILDSFGCDPAYYGKREQYLAETLEAAEVVDAVPVVRCERCTLHGNCLTEDTFVLAHIESPYCCVGKEN